MDWVAIGGIAAGIAAIVGCVTLLVTLSRDREKFGRELGRLEQRVDNLKDRTDRNDIEIREQRGLLQQLATDVSVAVTTLQSVQDSMRGLQDSMKRIEDKFVASQAHRSEG